MHRLRLSLHSSDSALDGLCRRLEVPSTQIEYHWADRDSEHCSADLHVWDCDGSCGPVDVLEPGSEHRHLFLLNPDELQSLCRRFPGSAPAVLLRPITEASLVQAVERCIERGIARSSEDRRRADRDELLRFLLLAGLKLQDQNSRRMNCLARALHDLRTPLMAAEGYCGLLIEGSLGPLSSEQAATLRRVQQGLRRMLKLATSMFQLSLGQTDREKPRLEPGDIAVRIHQAICEMAPVARSRAVEIAPDVQPCPDLLFDGDLIEQAVLSLLENACRFSPRHSVVEIHGRPVHCDFANFLLEAADSRWYRPALNNGRPNAYRFEVRDSGARVPADRLAVLFEHDLGPGGSQDRSGQGLGLATCKMIIAAHKGELTAESGERGVQLSFVLPFLRPVDPPPGAGVGRASFIGVA
jgi:signal transduction histidine kinase